MVAHGMPDRDAQRRRIIVTTVILAAIALGFYLAIFVRHW